MKLTNQCEPSEASPVTHCHIARSLTFRWRVFLVSLAVLLPAPTVTAGVIAVGAMDTQTDWSVFVNRRGTGHTCVSLEVAGVTNAAGESPCKIDVGILGSVFGVGSSWPGQGITAAKPGSSSFGDSLTGGVTPTAASGSAAWGYEPGPLGLIDVAAYAASTSIIPTPTKDSAHARAEAADPVLFDATTAAQLGVSAVLSALSLAVEAPGNVAAFGGDYALDGTTLFQFYIAASFGFTGPDDLDVAFSSILGSSFDDNMRSTLVNALALNADLGTVELRDPVTVFPRTVLEFGTGSHEIDARSVAAVEAPEPTTLPLFGIGLFGIVAAGMRRVKNLR